MTREIKFRAWSLEEKIMSKPFTLENCCNECGTYTGTSMAFKHGSLIMQYTGLKDKNGKEIYEGDILSVKDKEVTGYDEEIGVVTYNSETEPNYGWGWRIEWLHSTHQALMVILSKTAETKIIGNIHENPELLTK